MKGEAKKKMPTKGPVSVLRTVYCRGIQYGMKIAQYAVGYRTPICVEGPGCIAKLPELIRSHRVKKILVVMDAGLVRVGLADRLYRILDSAGIPYAVYDEVQPNPTAADVEAGLKIYLSEKCDALVAMGGGSAMDTAKAVGARSLRPKKSVRQLQGTLTVIKHLPCFFGIPTTSGSGSETTCAAVITDVATGRKAAINDPFTMPQIAILDPELVLSLPPHITATTGMDALTHAVESYTNGIYNTKLENKLARAAVKLIHDNLYDAYMDGSDLKARQNMQKAAFFAGRAFTRGGVGYIHALGHPMSSLYGAPHGLAMSVLQPYVLKAYGPVVYDRLAELADVCGLGGDSNQEKAENFIFWIEEMNEKMKIPKHLDFLHEEDFGQIVKWAMKEANPVYPVPVVWGRKQFRSILNEVKG